MSDITVGPDHVMDDEAFLMAVEMGLVGWGPNSTGSIVMMVGDRRCYEQYARLRDAGKVKISWTQEGLKPDQYEKVEIRR